MARRTLRPESRVFAGKRKNESLGALLLVLSLVVAGFGIATALYLERPAAPRLARAPQQTVALPEAPHDPVIAAAVPDRAELPPVPAALPAIEPQAGTSAPPPPQTAALEPPPPESAPVARLPAPAIAGGRTYWVEYGAFVGETYARRLQRALAARGLAAVVVATHGRDGRKLLRVRSAALADLATARAAAAAARSALRLAALLHRGDPTAAAAPRYWVQFGAFAKPRPAARLRRELRRAGVAASVSSVQASHGKSLYLVRSAPLSNHADAIALGERGQRVAQTDFFIGERAVASPHARGPPSPIAATR